MLKEYCVFIVGRNSGWQGTSMTVGEGQPLFEYLIFAPVREALQEERRKACGRRRRLPDLMGMLKIIMASLSKNLIWIGALAECLQNHLPELLGLLRYFSGISKDTNIPHAPQSLMFARHGYRVINLGCGGHRDPSEPHLRWYKYKYFLSMEMIGRQSPQGKPHHPAVSQPCLKRVL